MNTPTVRDLCEAEWLPKSGFGLTYEQFFAFTFMEGVEPGDIVFTSPEGVPLTPRDAQRWVEDWNAFFDGFQTAWFMCLTQQQERQNAKS